MLSFNQPQLYFIMLQIVISNKHLPENIPFMLDDQLPAFLAQNDEYKGYTTHNPEIEKWAVENEELNRYFDIISNNFQFEKEWVIHAFFKTIAFVDHKFARKVLNLPYKEKEDFFEKFEATISKFRTREEINYIPYCMSSTITLAMLMCRIPRQSYEIPDEVIPYLFPISGKDMNPEHSNQPPVENS